MSESDDEAAFASADEGKEEKIEPKGKVEDTAATGVTSAAAVANTTSSSCVSESKKDTGQGKRKKKGRKGNKKENLDTTKNEQQTKDATNTEKLEKEDTKASANDTKEDVKTPEKAKIKAHDKAKQDDAKASEKAKKDVTKKQDSKDLKVEDSVKEISVKETSPEKEVLSINSETKFSNVDSNTPESQVVLDSSKVEVEKITSSPETVQMMTPNSQDIPRSVADVKEPEVNEETEKASGGWGSWGGWGSSLLNVASSSVTSFTSQVGEGLTTLVETVESSLGVPAAEEIARLNQEEEKEKSEVKSKISSESDVGQSEVTPGNHGDADVVQATNESSDNIQKAAGGGWFAGVSSFTSKIHDKGKSLVSGSLDAVEALASGSIDVLENIGKKTIGVLSEHDPGFINTKKVMFDHGKKASLSSLLREAKERQEQVAVEREEEEEARKHNYGAVFDDHQGLAHLEALEILSNQSEKKVQSLLTSITKEQVAAIKPDLLEIKEIFELDDADFEERQEHEFSNLITNNLSELHLGTTPDKLNKVQHKNRQWIIDFYADVTGEDATQKYDPKDVYHAAIDALAELTAKSVEQFHKAGELILLQQDSDTTYKQRSKSLASLTQVLCTEVAILSTKFSQCLHKLGEELEEGVSITPFVTNVYLEASNSSTYIQDGFQLLLPVLQQASIQNSSLLET